MTALGIYSLKRRRVTGIGILIINLRQSYDRLRFTMGIPIQIKRCLLSELFDMKQPWKMRVKRAGTRRQQDVKFVVYIGLLRLSPHCGRDRIVAILQWTNSCLFSSMAFVKCWFYFDEINLFPRVRLRMMYCYQHMISWDLVGQFEWRKGYPFCKYDTES